MEIVRCQNREIVKLIEKKDMLTYFFFLNIVWVFGSKAAAVMGHVDKQAIGHEFK